MAEFAQQSIEEMLPELEHMKGVGLFTDIETKKILKKRKAYEYKLRKTVKEKNDYIKYISYEMQVLALVKKRRKQLHISEKRSEIDVSIVMRIHQLYKIACMRFADDEMLWINHIGFAKSRQEHVTVSRLFTSVLKLHPHKPALWITAAQYEMDDRSSMDNARHILQKGLRFNPDDKTLWVEYFRMELLNAEKLRKRDQILGISADNDQDNPRSAIHGGEVAKIVYRNAIEKIPEVELCISFLTATMEFSFTDSIVDYIFSDLKERFSEHEMAMAVAAKRPLLDLDRLERLNGDDEPLPTEKTRQMILESFRLFDECVRQINSESMWDMYLETCVQITQRSIDPQLHSELLERSNRTFHRAAEASRLSESLAVEWINMLRCGGRLDEAVVACDVIMTHHKKSSSCWLERLNLFSLLYTQTSQNSRITDCFQQAVGAISNVDSGVEVWKFIYEWCISNGENNMLVSLFEKGLESKSKAVCVHVKLCYLEWTAMNGNVKAVRKLYKRYMEYENGRKILCRRRCMLTEGGREVWLGLAKLVNSGRQGEMEKPKMKKLRRAYDTILQQYGSSNIDLWIKYLELEMFGVGGKPENMGTIHWRAMHSLQPNLKEQFNERYTLLLNKSKTTDD